MTEEGVERFTSGIRKRFHTIAHSKIINNTLSKKVICYYNFSIRKVDIRDSTDLTFIRKSKSGIFEKHCLHAISNQVDGNFLTMFTKSGAKR